MSVTERSKTRRASSRTNPTRAKRRQREIIDAAAEIFHRKGYSETSMQEIAEAVGILKGSLYYYIDSKEDLLFQMLLEVHEHAKGIVEETAALEVPAVERLRAYVQRHVEYNVQNLSKIAVYYHDFGLLTAKRKRAIMDQRRYYELFVIGLIEDAKADGSVDGSVDASLVANAIFGVVNWIYTWYRPSGSASPQYLGKLYAELIVNGISSGNIPAVPKSQTTSNGRSPGRAAKAKASARRSTRTQ
jgi:TetR/AcrR family transcriptional regulator, cholesterol catabolism regulator